MNPGDAKVVQFFGRYLGTVRRAGLIMTVPLSTTKKVSVKVHNFETHEIKVNDADGNLAHLPEGISPRGRRDALRHGHHRTSRG